MSTIETRIAIRWMAYKFGYLPANEDAAQRAGGPPTRKQSLSGARKALDEAERSCLLLRLEWPAWVRARPVSRVIRRRRRPCRQAYASAVFTLQIRRFRDRVMWSPGADSALLSVRNPLSLGMSEKGLP